MKFSGIRWYIIALIFLSTVINFIDRSTINILWPYIHEDFGISVNDSKEALAFITSFFLVAYAVGQTFWGKIMDVIGTRIGLSLAIIGWSIAIGLHAVCRSLNAFALCRFLLGFNESANWPGATKNNAEWFPVKERAIAQGIFNAGSSIGTVVAAPLVAALYLSYGWRITFVMIAALGLLWIVPWLYFNKPGGPQKHPWITARELEYIEQQSKQNQPQNEMPSISYSWKQLLGFRQTWAILISRFLIDPVWWLFITWLPTLLKQQYAFDIKQVGAFSWLPFVVAAFGGIGGGLYSSFCINRGESVIKVRKKSLAIGSVLMLISLTIIACFIEDMQQNTTLLMALISATLFGFQFLISNLQTLPSDYFHGKNVGIVAGMAGSSAVLGTVLTTWLIPYITRHSFQSFFVLGALLVPLAWGVIAFLAKPKNQTNE
ncbi:MAG: MFS transporter [Niabella sp.]